MSVDKSRDDGERDAYIKIKKDFVLIGLFVVIMAFLFGNMVGEYRVLARPCATMCSVPASLR